LTEGKGEIGGGVGSARGQVEEEGVRSARPAHERGSRPAAARARWGRAAVG
jgi:hypothetical protein